MADEYDYLKGKTNTELDNIYRSSVDFLHNTGLDKFGGGFKKSISELSDQIKIYKEANTVKEQAATEKRRIQEKEIRMLRSNYRPGRGLMGGGGDTQPATLGSTNVLPNKLGTA